jgi:protein SCO1/2
MVESLKKLQKLFDEKKRAADFLIISFDPENDTVSALSKYRKEKKLDYKNWTFLTGNETDTRKIAMVLGIRFNKNPESGAISHDNKILLINGKGEIEKELVGLNIDPNDAF